jgi:hypothetical protein
MLTARSVKSHHQPPKFPTPENLIISTLSKEYYNKTPLVGGAIYWSFFRIVLYEVGLNFLLGSFFFINEIVIIYAINTIQKKK